MSPFAAAFVLTLFIATPNCRAAAALHINEETSKLQKTEMKQRPKGTDLFFRVLERHRSDYKLAEGKSDEPTLTSGYFPARRVE